MFTFCMPVSVFSNAVPETYIIPCHFCEAKFFKIPLPQLPIFSLTSHQMSIPLRLEAMHHWKHLTGQPQLPFLQSTQNHRVRISFLT